MIAPTRWLSRFLLVLAAGVGVGSVVLFVARPLGTLRVLSPGWPEPANLAWDAVLSLLFFAQHSGMLRRRFRARLGMVVAPSYHAAVYATASGLALLAVVLLWQPSEVRVFSLTGSSRYLALALSLAGIGTFVWGVRSLRSFDPLGLVPVLAHLRGRPYEPGQFVVRGAYGMVRHPLYLGVLMLVWSCPDVTADRLLFNALWTAWIVLGTLLEERDLLAEFGDVYRVYRREVPMLVPRLARGEGWVVAQIVLMALVAFGPRAWPGAPAWPVALARLGPIAGIVLMVIGAALVGLGIAALGRNLSAVPRPIPGATLVERGPYRLVRHPMYAGAVLVAFGWALSVHGILTLGYAAALLVFFDVKARREERWLCEKVAGYAAYQLRARRLIPFIY
jgi:protein-S-isoprenylcysteine O-methyltransferase Ste14